MKWKRFILIILPVMLLLAGAALFYERETGRADNCFYGDVDYVSVLQWDGVVYQEDYASPAKEQIKGKRLGKSLTVKLTISVRGMRCLMAIPRCLRPVQRCMR